MRARCRAAGFHAQGREDCAINRTSEAQATQPITWRYSTRTTATVRIEIKPGVAASVAVTNIFHFYISQRDIERNVRRIHQLLRSSRDAVDIDRLLLLPVAGGEPNKATATSPRHSCSILMLRKIVRSPGRSHLRATDNASVRRRVYTIFDKLIQAHSVLSSQKRQRSMHITRPTLT